MELSTADAAFIAKLIDNELHWCDSVLQSCFDEEAVDETIAWYKELEALRKRIAP